MAMTHRLKNSQVEALLFEDPPQDPLPDGVTSEDTVCDGVTETEYQYHGMVVTPGKCYLLTDELGQKSVCSVGDLANLYEALT